MHSLFVCFPPTEAHKVLYSIRLIFEVCTVKWTDLKPQEDFLSLSIALFFGLQLFGTFFVPKKKNISLMMRSLLHAYFLCRYVYRKC